MPFRPAGILVLLAALALALAAAPVHAQQLQGSVTGTVVDSTTGRALPFATIAVAGTPRGANAGVSGKFTILELDPGRWTLRASYIGYDTRERVVEVEAGRTTTVTLRLPPLQAAGTTKKVVVTAERGLVDVSEVSTVREVDAADIKELTVDALSDVVERQVGVSGENQELHVRGGRSDETLFRIENVAMKNVVTGAAVGGTFSAKAVQNLEVITGGYEAEYGQAISGIVNVELKEAGYQPRTSVEVSGGSFDTERLFLQTEGPLTPQNYPLPGRITMLLGLDVLASDTYLPSRRRATDHGFGMRRTLRSGMHNSFSGLQWNYDDFLRLRQDNDMNLYAKFTWRLTQRHKLNMTFTKFVGIDHGFFQFRVGDEVRDAASGNTRYLWAFRDQMDQAPTVTEETSLQALNWRWAMSDRTYANLSISHFLNNQETAVRGKRPWVPGEAYEEWRPTGRDTFFVSDDNGDFPQYQNLLTERWSMNGAYTRRWLDHHEFKAGMEASYFTVQMIRIDNPREGEGGLGSVRDLYRVYPNDGAFFAQNKFSYEGFAGHVGLRADYLFLGEAADEAVLQQESIRDDYLRDTHSLFGRRYKIFWSPRLAINHPITERDAMHFNFGHFTQWPRLIYYFSKISSRSSEAFPLEGNLNLDPERSVQFEFGVKHQFSDFDAIDITVFNKDTYDYPTATRTIEATRTRLVYVNSDFSRTRGLELVYQRRGGKRVSAHVSYEFQIATGKPADPNRIKQVDPEALETGEAEPDLNEEFMPWNRPHRVQASFGMRFRPGDRPRLFGLQLPDRWGFNFFYSMRSGRPYTPTDERGDRIGKRNSENAPFESVLDFKLDKHWRLGSGGQFGFNLQIRNLLDTPPLRVVDSNTGDAPAMGRGTLCDGCITSDVSRDVIRDRIANPAYYGEGRNFRFGMEVSF